MHANRLLSEVSAIALGLYESELMNAEASQPMLAYKFRVFELEGDNEDEGRYYRTLSEAVAAMDHYLSPGAYRVLADLETGEEIIARKSTHREEMDFLFAKMEWEREPWQIRNFLNGY